MPKSIRTHNAPAPGGHYSQAIKAGDYVFVSGSGPFDPKNHEIVGTSIEEQTRRTLDNISAILAEAGTSLKEVVKITVFLKNIADFKGMDSIFKETFRERPPARTTVQAELVGEGRLIVVDAIAYCATR